MPYLSVSVTAPALLSKSFTKLDELVRACNKVVKIIREVIISILFKDAFNLLKLTVFRLPFSQAGHVTNLN